MAFNCIEIWSSWCCTWSPFPEGLLLLLKFQRLEQKSFKVKWSHRLSADRGGGVTLKMRCWTVSLGFCLEYRGAHFRGQTTREGNKRRGRFTLCTVAASMWKALLSTSLPAWLSAVIFSEACISLTRKCDQKFTRLNFVLSGFLSTWGVALFSVFWVTSDAEVESKFDGTLYDTYLISAPI